METEGVSENTATANWQSVVATLDLMRAQVAAHSAQAGVCPEEVVRHTVGQMIEARQVRREFFPDELLGEPAWDMLLALFARDLDSIKTSVGTLCAASGVPATTALRWIDKLHRAGLIMRENDPSDARRGFVLLSDKGHSQVRQYLVRAMGGVQAPNQG